MSRKSKSVVQTSESDRKDLSAPETAVSQDAATSTPSGLGGPDGSNPSHTPESESEGGDAAGKASAETVKPQDNSGTPSETTVVETGNSQSHAPEAEASASGDTMFNVALRSSGCTSLEDLVDMAIVGRSLMENIAYYAALEGPLKGWAPAEDPVEVVGDLYDQLVEALADNADTGAAPEAASAEPENVLNQAAYLARYDVRVKADIDGFRRAGHVHGMDWRVFEEGDLSIEQLAELIEDPAITIERV